MNSKTSSRGPSPNSNPHRRGAVIGRPSSASGSTVGGRGGRTDQKTPSPRPTTDAAGRLAKADRPAHVGLPSSPVRKEKTTVAAPRIADQAVTFGPAEAPILQSPPKGRQSAAVRAKLRHIVMRVCVLNFKICRGRSRKELYLYEGAMLTPIAATGRNEN